MRGGFKNIFLNLLILSLIRPLQAQTPIGTWQTHFSYVDAKEVAIAGNKIYCATNNGFFYVDNAAKQAIKLSKLDGFSENGISKIKYSPLTKTLIIGYQSGGIDLLTIDKNDEPEKITTVTLIKESTNIQTKKQLNHIEIKDKTAYLSYDFGLVVLDIEKQEIKETYQNLGNNGAAINIYQAVVAPDSIYLATSQGIRVAKFSNTVNLQFFGNWNTLINKQLVINKWKNGLVFASNVGEIFTYQAGKYSNFFKIKEPIERIEQIGTEQYFIKTTTNANILNIEALDITKITNADYPNPQSLQVDVQGKYWFADLVKGLVSNNEGTFKSYSPSSLDTLYQVRKDSIVTDLDGNRWRRAPNLGGIVVTNAKNQQKYITTGAGFGALPSENVKTLALDKDGQMWVGTDKGVVVFDNTSAVFSGKNFDAYTPVFERRRLLSNETITTIAIDGGNRKWMGTRNGIFLFTADGTELVTNFTEKNAPLPTNDITYMTVEPTNGDVYIQTPKGMVSYRGTATQGDTQQQVDAVKVFPNPVRPDFEGQIGISGLVENAYVKITDIAGNLIYETRANGATAVWDGKTLKGTRAETGVYLIFSSNAKGEETLVSKLAIVQ